MRKGTQGDHSFQRDIHRFYAIAATENQNVAAELHGLISQYKISKSSKINWIKEGILRRVEWSANE